jgi:hypothetical protein
MTKVKEDCKDKDKVKDCMSGELFDYLGSDKVIYGWLYFDLTS